MGTNDDAVYSEDSDEKPIDLDSIGALIQLGTLLLQREAEVARATQALADAQGLLDRVQCQLIPDMMDRHKLRTWVFIDPTTGLERTIRREDKWRVSMPGKEHAKARATILEWLERIGQGASIKRNVVLPIGKRPLEFIERLVREIKTSHPELSPEYEQFVEPSTLTAVVTRRLRAEQDAAPLEEDKRVPPEVNVLPVRRAIVTDGK